VWHVPLCLELISVNLNSLPSAHTALRFIEQTGTFNRHERHYLMSSQNFNSNYSIG
jgi:hypothetical protein